jgi:hypothetical protein
LPPEICLPVAIIERVALDPPQNTELAEDFTETAHFWLASLRAPLQTAPVLIRVSTLLAAAFLALFCPPGLILAGKPASPDAAPAIQLANISTRLAVGSGDNVLIAGFIVSGTQPKRVMIRALGPLLPVNENLGDPTLELHGSSGELLARNDNWRDTQESELEATTIAPANDYDSSIIQSLSPGAYTAIVAGKGGTTGIGLVEVYDLDRNVDSKLANIAARGRVDQGDNILIAGTIVLGNGTTTVLFRALGPSTGVPNRLEDPTLELHDGQGGVVATNDNWQDSQRDAIEQTGIPPSDLKESAILQTLSPGAYTAVVRGKNNTTGVGVIEAYQIN